MYWWEKYVIKLAEKKGKPRGDNNKWSSSFSFLKKQDFLLSRRFPWLNSSDVYCWKCYIYKSLYLYFAMFLSFVHISLYCAICNFFLYISLSLYVMFISLLNISLFIVDILCFYKHEGITNWFRLMELSWNHLKSSSSEVKDMNNGWE